MKETIRFRGLTLNKDEQSAEHGELALCAGVEMHDGALRASVLQGTDVGNIPGTLVYVRHLRRFPDRGKARAGRCC